MVESTIVLMCLHSHLHPSLCLCLAVLVLVQASSAPRTGVCLLLFFFAFFFVLFDFSSSFWFFLLFVSFLFLFLSFFFSFLSLPSFFSFPVSLGTMQVARSLLLTAATTEHSSSQTMVAISASGHACDQVGCCSLAVVVLMQRHTLGSSCTWTEWSVVSMWRQQPAGEHLRHGWCLVFIYWSLLNWFGSCSSFWWLMWTVSTIEIPYTLCSVPHEMGIDQVTGALYVACVGAPHSNILRYLPTNWVFAFLHCATITFGNQTTLHNTMKTWASLGWWCRATPTYSHCTSVSKPQTWYHAMIDAAVPHRPTYPVVLGFMYYHIKNKEEEKQAWSANRGAGMSRKSRARSSTRLCCSLRASSASASCVGSKKETNKKKGKERRK